MGPAAVLRWNYKPQLKNGNNKVDLQEPNRVKRKHIKIHTVKMKMSPAPQRWRKTLEKDTEHTWFKGCSPKVYVYFLNRCVNSVLYMVNINLSSVIVIFSSF